MPASPLASFPPPARQGTVPGRGIRGVLCCAWPCTCFRPSGADGDHVSRGAVCSAVEGGPRKKKLSGGQRQKLAARRRAAEAAESSRAASTQKGEGETRGNPRTVDTVSESTPAAAAEQVLLPSLPPCLEKDEPHVPHHVKILMHLLPAGIFLTVINEQPCAPLPAA